MNEKCFAASYFVFVFCLCCGLYKPDLVNFCMSIDEQTFVLGGGAELRIVLVFLGPVTGFCLIFISRLDKLLFLPSFDEAQDKVIQIG